MDNTAMVDSGLLLLAIIGGWLFSDFLYRTRETAFKRVPLFLLVFAGFWCLFNWITHTIAVLVVNSKAMLAGTFVYSYYFYSLLLIGIAFAVFSGYQLNQIYLLSRGVKVFRQLKQVSFLIMVLSLPIFPLNPIGLLPVISSILILDTAAVTRKQWQKSRTETLNVEQVVPA